MAEIKRFITDLRDALTIATQGNLLKALILLAAILVFAVGFYFLLNYFFPKEVMMEYAEYGYAGVFLVSLVSTMSIVLPVPGIVVVIAAAGIWDPFLVSLVSSIGAALGGITGYGLGYGGRAVLSPQYTERYRVAEDWMRRRGGFAIFLFALIPVLLFDFVGIAAGVFRYKWYKFLIYSFLGRLPRTLAEVYTGAIILDYVWELFTC